MANASFQTIWYQQNPNATELDLEGLNSEEKIRILEVVKKEQEFVYKEGTVLMKGQIMEGQLSKFTNLMKGWQFRWFVLDPESGTLAYYLDKEKTRNRGVLPLAGSVISPSDEDSMSFMVNGSNGEVYKLRAIDAKDRQHWINLIRAVAEYHGHSVVKPPRPPPPPKESISTLKRSATIAVSSRYAAVKSPIEKIKNIAHHSQSYSQPSSPRVQTHTATKNPIKEELKNIKDALNSVNEYHSSAVESLENGQQMGDVTFTLDEQVLLLKATSQATVNILQQCYSILQQQAIELQGFTQSRGLPAGSTIEWFEPHMKRFERSMSMSSGLSMDSAIEAAGTLEDFVMISQYAEDEIKDNGNYLDDQPEDMESHKSVILHLLSQLKLGMDLTRVVLPTFVLEKKSLLEMYADFLGHPDLFIRIADGQTPEERMLAAVEFYLTSFHVGRKSGVAKKPYNPILGEHFHCSFESPNMTNGECSSNGVTETITGSSDRVYFTAERVSHHPPISAFYAECPSKKICMNTHIWTKSKFYGMSIGVINVGEGVISLPGYNEEYILTFPNAYCRSILTFPWVELGGRTFIRCAKTGFNAIVTFHTKPFHGGKANHITFEVKHSENEDAGEMICRGEGAWDGAIEFNYTKTGMKKLVDVTKLHVTSKRVRPLNIQGEFESRKLWQNVTEALQQGNLEAATEQKHKLEERQRNEKQQRLASGSEWKTRLFQKHSEAWHFNPHMAHVTRRKKSKSVTG